MRCGAKMASRRAHGQEVSDIPFVVGREHLLWNKRARHGRKTDLQPGGVCVGDEQVAVRVDAKSSRVVEFPIIASLATELAPEHSSLGEGEKRSEEKSSREERRKERSDIDTKGGLGDAMHAEEQMSSQRHAPG